MATTLIGLDGVERELETVTALCAGSHGLGNVSGYVLRQTSLTGGAHTDVAEYGGDDLLDASQAKGRLIDSLGYGVSGHYAVIDSKYACGCRGLG